ncbi:MAG TPA: hypothetical protein VLE27_15850 [Thermoanaerobaculia bacterium]|nr:hypothetical protein [Thermoanaerobaculia bacterium]
MPQRTPRALFAACALAAVLLLCLPGPVHAAPGTVTMDGWSMAWKWMWKLWGGGTEKSGSHIDPNGTTAPRGNGVDPDGVGAGDSGSGIDPNG